jgi:hypothetical protein
MNQTIKIVLAVLLILCLADMPYGFYQLVRFAACLGFTILAVSSNQKKQEAQAVIFVVLALLFQPFLKISFGRTLWNIIDVVVATGLLLSLFTDRVQNGDDVSKR